MAAFASSVVESIPIVLPLTRSAVASTCRIHVNTARWLSRSIRRRVREIVECSGGASSRPRPRNPRNAKTHSLLAKRLLGKGDREAACVELDQALGLVPNQREFSQLKNDIER